MTLRKRYEADFMAYDLIGAVLLAGALPMAINLTCGFAAFSSHSTPIKVQLYQALFGVSATLVGFVISACSVVLAFGELPRFQLLKDSGQYAIMFSVYFSAMKWLGVLAGISLIGMFVDDSESPRTWTIFVAAFFVTLCALRVYRCVWILKRLAQIACLPSKTNRPKAAA
jgi:hypothetical protein